MGVRSALGRVAQRAPVPVFPVVGHGGRLVAARLRLDDRLAVVDSPRHASILLIVGTLPPALVDAVRRVHDELPHPRATAWLPVGDAIPSSPIDLMSDAIRVSELDVSVTLCERVAELRSGARPSESDLLPDTDPVQWRGVGPYGQGGTGMTGGVPYGRPIAARAPDRDALDLDVLHVRVGPLFPALPPGLVLEVTLQGDVIQDASVGPNPYDGRPHDDAIAPARIAEVELERARHHLRWASEALRIAGLPALGLRTLAFAERLTPAQGRELERLATRIDRNLGLRLAHRGVGALNPEDLTGLGPSARAAGLADDARTLDPAYRALGFAPVTGSGSDVRARWRQRFAEAAQSLDLAARAGDAHTAQPQRETPWGTLSPDAPPPVDRLLDLVPALVLGREWGDAVASIVSLDLDLEAATALAASEVA